jgi:hypothetical protein
MAKELQELLVLLHSFIYSFIHSYIVVVIVVIKIIFFVFVSEKERRGKEKKGKRRE